MRYKSATRVVATLALLIPVLALASCATTQKQEDRAATKDAASVQAVKNRFMLGIQSGDIDEVMSLLTPNFTHHHFGDRESIRFYLTEARRRGYLDDVTINLRSTKESVGDDGYAMVGPIEFAGLFGHINATIYLKEVESKWFIHRVLMDI